MRDVKRAIAAVLLLAGCLALAYGVLVTRRENSRRDLMQKGDAAVAGGDLSGAIEAFSGAIALKPDSMVGYLKRGDAYRRRDELEAALRDLRRAVELDPGAPRPRELLGDVNYARHRFIPAIEHYQAYVDLDDRSPRVLYKLGLARYRAGQPALGIDALKKAIAIDDRFAEAYYLLGLCQRDVQKTNDALVSLHRALALAPAMIQAREELAYLYGRLGRSDEWIAQLDALRALDPNAERDVALGLAYSRAGQSDRAVITLRSATERHPEHRHTLVAIGRVWLETAQARNDRIELNKALEALEKAVAIEATSEALTLYGRALLLASDNELAERMLLQATQKLPAESLAFYYLGDAAARRGHYDVARQALLDYLGLEGEDPDARRRSQLATRIADLSMRVSDYPLAASYYERAVPALGSDPDFMLKFAEARWRAGQAGAAKAMVDRVLEKDPANPAARALARRIR
jgi:tetratricopeptide (TPR) repeat protein